MHKMSILLEKNLTKAYILNLRTMYQIYNCSYWLDWNLLPTSLLEICNLKNIIVIREIDKLPVKLKLSAA